MGHHVRALLQTHDVVAQEIYGEGAVRVTPPPGTLTSLGGGPVAGPIGSGSVPIATTFGSEQGMLDGSNGDLPNRSTIMMGSRLPSHQAPPLLQDVSKAFVTDLAIDANVP